MQKRVNRQKIIYGMIAAILFAGIFLLKFPGMASGEKDIQAQVVLLGDSILGQNRSETGIATLLEEVTNMSVFNGAFGGTCAARMEGDNRMDYPKGSLSLVRLVKSLYAGDFRVQQTGIYRDTLTEYFEEVIDDYERLNLENVEIVVIQHGVNDYHAGTPIENPEDPYDEYTFLGALRTSVETLRQVNPDVRIVLVTPPYAWYVTYWKTCEEMDFGGGLLEEYVNAEIAFAEEMGLEVIDMYHDFIPTKDWDDCGVYTHDGLHPNEAGRELWAERIAGVLMK